MLSVDLASSLNEELERLAAKEKINILEACTLVMLSTGQY